MLALYIFSLVLGGGFLLLSLFGDFLETDVAELDVDADADVSLEAGPSSGALASKLLSIRGLIYGLFGFGGVGTLLTLVVGGSTTSTAVFAVSGGVLSGALISWMFSYVKESSSGERRDERSYIGLVGRVTLPIQSESAGQIDVLRGDRTYRLRALPHVSAERPDPDTWSRVVVVEMKDGVAMVVPEQDLLSSG
jgi:membrane protein implicated in regulation of membrane protease activity